MSDSKTDIIVRNCINDRTRSLKGQQIGLFRKNAFDLSVKYIVLLLNMVGRKMVPEFIFVDEINNKSMRNNLFDTMVKVEESNKNIGVMNFYSRTTGSHVKLGVIRPISEILKYCLMLIPPFLQAYLFRINVFDSVVRKTAYCFSIFLKNLVTETPPYYVLMTDHHYFSSIIAGMYEECSVVIQHGLIKEIDYYYPIIAGQFLAWGERTKQLLNNDKKVQVVGTYKFERIMNSNKVKRNIHDILFCMSSLDEKTVDYKIRILANVCIEYGFSLSVKCHPGSLFHLEKWKERLSGYNIKWYQEEMLEDISFDLAVTEDSTIIIDLIHLNSPFILFDKKDGYFEPYLSCILHGNSEAELKMCFERLPEFDFSEAVESISKYELNNKICNIAERLAKQS